MKFLLICTFFFYYSAVFYHQTMGQVSGLTATHVSASLEKPFALQENAPQKMLLLVGLSNDFIWVG